MNSEILLDAVSNIDIEIIENYYKYKKALPKLRKQRLYKCLAIAASFCIIVSSVLVISHFWKSNPYDLPVDVDEIIWYKGNGSISDSDATVSEWNGLYVTSELKEALNKAENSDYLALIVRKLDDSLMKEYVYDGKKYSEYEAERDALYLTSAKLESILREGDLLKYGELLYTEGIPGGEWWEKSYYEERISYYGEEFLNKYIISGEFLKDDVEKDLAQNELDTEAIYDVMEQAMLAYTAKNAEEMLGSFTEKGYFARCKSGSLFLFITKDELANLNVENKEMYEFSLASRFNYIGRENVKPPKVTDKVKGFALEKFHIYNGRYEIKTDKDIADAINSVIDIHKYSDSQALEFNFYVDREVSEDMCEEIFKDMNYEQLYYSSYFPSVKVIVSYKDINMKALKELSQRDDIRSIKIDVSSTIVDLTE